MDQRYNVLLDELRPNQRALYCLGVTLLIISILMVVFTFGYVSGFLGIGAACVLISNFKSMDAMKKKIMRVSLQNCCNGCCEQDCCCSPSHLFGLLLATLIFSMFQWLAFCMSAGLAAPDLLSPTSFPNRPRTPSNSDIYVASAIILSAVMDTVQLIITVISLSQYMLLSRKITQIKRGQPYQPYLSPGTLIRGFMSGSLDLNYQPMNGMNVPQPQMNSMNGPSPQPPMNGMNVPNTQPLPFYQYPQQQPYGAVIGVPNPVAAFQQSQQQFYPPPPPAPPVAMYATPNFYAQESQELSKGKELY
jgi:hypothetical protein